ncbi:MAG: hypothetical protein HY893_02030 [Deltaproteobacteria bacterium]|nr:hypothetical protein [Deltaproteobacteria bacterium]
MKIYKLPQLAELSPENEYRLGKEELATSSVYLLYGRLRPKESSKKLTVAEGSDEIICVVKGNIKVRCGKTVFSVGPGEAFHSKAAQSFLLDNLGDEEAVYIAAGGSAAKAEEVVEEKTAGLKATAEEDLLIEPAAEPEGDEFEITDEEG